MPRVVHFEIHADDPDRAHEFYNKLFGWGIERWQPPADMKVSESKIPEYWLVVTGGNGEKGINGGLLKRPKGTSPGLCDNIGAFVCTVDVDNLDKYIGLVEDLGGQLTTGRMPVTGIGWLAYAKDTEGNTFGMLEMDESVRNTEDYK